MFLRGPLDMFNKTDAITEKIMDTYKGQQFRGVLELGRIFCLMNLLIEIGKCYGQKKCKQLEQKSYIFLDYTKKKDYREYKIYQFLIPLFFEQYTWTFMFSDQIQDRGILQKIVTLADYYEKKMEQHKLYEYTLFYKMIAFNVYRSNQATWRIFLNQITQSISNYSINPQYSTYVYAQFINSFKNGEILQEGEEENLISYLEILIDKMQSSNMQKSDLSFLQIVNINTFYKIIYPEEQASLYQNTGRISNYQEFQQLVESRYDLQNIKNAHSYHYDIELLYNYNIIERAEILQTEVKNIFVKEPLKVELRIKNDFNVFQKDKHHKQYYLRFKPYF